MDAIDSGVEALDAFDCDVHQLAGGEFAGGNQMRLGGRIEERDIVPIHARSIGRPASDIKVGSKRQTRTGIRRLKRYTVQFSQ